MPLRCRAARCWVSAPPDPAAAVAGLPALATLYEQRPAIGLVVVALRPHPHGGCAGIAISIAALLLLTRHKLTLSLPAMLALVCALFAMLAGDWAIKSIIKHLTQEPRPYLLWLEGQSLIPAIQQFYSGSVEVRSEQVHAASLLLALPEWLTDHWQAEVNYAFPSGHSIAAMSLAQFFGLIWLARAPSGVWLLPLWALGIGLSRMLIGMHWPMDVLASALLGSLTALFAARWWLRRY